MGTRRRASGPKPLPRTGSDRQRLPLEEVVAAYRAALDRQPLATSTRRAYRAKIDQFAGWLAATDGDFGDPLTDPAARNYAARDFKAHLTRGRRSPRTINLALAALDSFYRFVGLGPPDVKREQLPAEAPRALDADEQRRVLRAVEQRGRPRDRALVALALFAGLRLGELVAVEVDDVALSARKGRVIVRRGKGDTHREVPLNGEARSAVEAWIHDRRGWPGASLEALFLSERGGRLTARAVDLMVRQVGEAARVELSATCCATPSAPSSSAGAAIWCSWPSWPGTAGWRPPAATAFPRPPTAKLLSTVWPWSTDRPLRGRKALLRKGRTSPLTSRRRNSTPLQPVATGERPRDTARTPPVLGAPQMPGCCRRVTRLEQSQRPPRKHGYKGVRMKVVRRRMWAMMFGGIGVLLAVFVALMVFPALNEPLVTLATLVPGGVAVARLVRKGSDPGAANESMSPATSRSGDFRDWGGTAH
jgi:site-specific recombinase XerC